MRWTNLLYAGVAMSLFAGLLSSPAAAGAAADPPGTTLIMGQLRAVFAAWDLDGDGYLDKQELAKAFRGADAKPYDFKAEKSENAKPKDADGDKKESDSGKNTSKPDYSQYPDYNFLVALDSDHDQKISKDEFDSWARDYAVTLKQQLDALQRIAAVEQKLAAIQAAGARITAKEAARQQKAFESELKKEQAAYKKLTKDAKNFEKHLQQAMKQIAKQAKK